jgi:Flp pilus assembly protein TadG
MNSKTVPGRRQSGVTTVEFAMVAAALLLAVFTVIEIGRLLWTWESLAEATRRGARVAAVCPVNHAAIANVAVFNDPAASGESAVLTGFSTDHVSVSYLDQDGSIVGDPMNNWCRIQFVRVSVTGYVHNFVVPMVGSFLNAPEFETTLSSESLGLVPGVGFQCFGAASPTPDCA